MPSAADLLLLGLLARKSMHGYEIRQVLDDFEIENWTSISTTHIYWVLSKLEKAGLVQVAVEQEGNRPPRKTYSITEKGRQEAASLLKEGVGTEQIAYLDIDILLITLGMVPELCHEERTELMYRRRRFLEKQLARTKEVWDSSTRIHKMIPAVHEVYEHRVATLKTELDWICEVIERVERVGWDRFYRVVATTVPV